MADGSGVGLPGTCVGDNVGDTVGRDVGLVDG